MLVLLAAVMALDTADKGTVGAVATQLERHLHLGHVEIGLIATVSSIVGAIATVPIGALTDRVPRVRLLVGSIVLWAAATVAGGAATSFAMLIVARVALGAVTATAGPTLASLIGDLFEPRERARVWGTILSGELIGAGIGLVVSGEVAALLSWRWAFWWLAVPGVAIAVVLALRLPEPARDGADRFPAAARDDAAPRLSQEIVRRAHVAPREDLVLRVDPATMSLGAAVRYVLSIRTNVALIAASSLGYIFFAGVHVFIVVLVRSRYGLSQATATALLGVAGAGAVGGVIAGGRIADRLLRSGRVNARIVVPAVAYAVAVAALLPADLSSSIPVSLPLLIIGAAALSAANAPLNAARLDIMHGRLWGRAESVRTLAQLGAMATAPLAFGYVSRLLGGPTGGQAAGGPAEGAALAATYAIMLGPLALSALMLLAARRTYPQDVATAAASRVAQPS